MMTLSKNNEQAFETDRENPVGPDDIKLNPKVYFYKYEYPLHHRIHPLHHHAKNIPAVFEG